MSPISIDLGEQWSSLCLPSLTILRSAVPGHPRVTKAAVFDIITPDVTSCIIAGGAELIMLLNDCLHSFPNLAQSYEIHISHSRSRQSFLPFPRISDARVSSRGACAESYSGRSASICDRDNQPIEVFSFPEASITVEEGSPAKHSG